MNDMPNPNIMLEATRLTRARRLTDATALLQRMLRGETKPEMTFDTADAVAPTRGNPPIIDAKTEAIAETHRPL